MGSGRHPLIFSRKIGVLDLHFGYQVYHSLFHLTKCVSFAFLVPLCAEKVIFKPTFQCPRRREGVNGDRTPQCSVGATTVTVTQTDKVSVFTGDMGKRTLVKRLGPGLSIRIFPLCTPVSTLLCRLLCLKGT